MTRVPNPQGTCVDRTLITMPYPSNFIDVQCKLI